MKPNLCHKANPGQKQIPGYGLPPGPRDWMGIQGLGLVLTNPGIDNDDSSLFDKFIYIQQETQNKNLKEDFNAKTSETKIIEIGQAVLEIFNFKDPDLYNFTRTK